MIFFTKFKKRNITAPADRIKRDLLAVRQGLTFSLAIFRELGQALSKNPVDKRTYDDVARAWAVDPGRPDQAGKAILANTIAAISYIVLCALCTVSLADSIVNHRIINIVSCAIGAGAGFIFALSALWRREVFMRRKYRPFYVWLKQGGSIIATVLLLSTFVAVNATPTALNAEVVDLTQNKSNAGSKPNIEMPSNITITKENDASAAIMKRLFGSTWEMIAGTNGAKIAVGDNVFSELIVETLSVLNLTALTMLAAFTLYTVGIFAVGSAHEGKKLGGSQYSSLWLPVRHTLSYALTAPIIKGLGLLQAIVLASIAFSINFANLMWDGATKYFIDSMSNNIIATSTMTHDEAYRMLPMMFSSSVYAEIIKFRSKGQEQYEVIEGNTIAYEAVKDTYLVEDKGNRITIAARPVYGVDKTELGYVSFEYSGPVQKAIAMARKDAILQLWDGAAKLAKKYLGTPGVIPSTRAAYADIGSGGAKTQDELIDEYVKTVNDATREVQKAYIDNDPGIKGSINRSLDYDGGTNGSKHGWIVAGLHSFSLAKTQQKIDQMLFTAVNVSPPNLESAFKKGPQLFKLEGEYASYASAYYSSKIASGLSYSASAMVNVDQGIMSGAIQDVASMLVLDHGIVFGNNPNQMQNSTNVSKTGILAALLEKYSNTDPIVVTQAFGDRMVDAGLFLMSGGAISSIFGGLASKLTGWLGSVAGGGTQYVSSLITMLAVALLSCGIILAYLLPIIPATFWMRALISWIFFCVEAIVAAPFFALSIIISSGKSEGLLGDAGKQGAKLLLDLACRPPLLVIGAVTSLAVIKVCGFLVWLMFSMWFSNSAVELGLMANIVYSIIVVSTYYTISTLVFSRGISHLPEKISRWIGSSGLGNFGDESDVHQGGTRVVGMATSQGTQAVTMANRQLGQERNKDGKGGGKDDAPLQIAKKTNDSSTPPPSSPAGPAGPSSPPSPSGPSGPPSPPSPSSPAPSSPAPSSPAGPAGPASSTRASSPASSQAGPASQASSPASPPSAAPQAPASSTRASSPASSQAGPASQASPASSSTVSTRTVSTPASSGSSSGSSGLSGISSGSPSSPASSPSSGHRPIRADSPDAAHDTPEPRKTRRPVGM